MIGMIESKSISNHIQALNQEFDEIVINIPNNRVVKNSVFSNNIF